MLFLFYFDRVLYLFLPPATDIAYRDECNGVSVLDINNFTVIKLISHLTFVRTKRFIFLEIIPETSVHAIASYE